MPDKLPTGACPPSYHERQFLLCCGLHATNAILQDHRFSRRDFERLSLEITQIDGASHKNFLGLGNYDANVIQRALQRSGYRLEWFDKRRPLSELELDLPAPSNKRDGQKATETAKTKGEEDAPVRPCVGLLVNVEYPRPALLRWMGFEGSHWYTLRRVDRRKDKVEDSPGKERVEDTGERDGDVSLKDHGVWMNFDSRFPSPVVIGSSPADVFAFLNKELQAKVESKELRNFTLIRVLPDLPSPQSESARSSADAIVVN
mmetsp:Transcript_20321/g.40692  ORF Transcript_20321/g.40692 Transcript_20321/m.40692 type:complete len:260 (-) Transcript_20321:152-931(-)